MNAQIMLVFKIGENGEGRLYADIMNNAPDRFVGELRFRQDIDFKKAAELFGGEFVYPQDMEECGFDVNQYIEERAVIYYKRSDGSFGVTVSFTDPWSGMYGCGKFCIDSIKGCVEYTGGNSKQYDINLSGEFCLGEQKAKAMLKLAVMNAKTDETEQPFSEKKEISTILSLAFGNISLDAFIDSISGEDSYAELPIPDDYGKPEHAYSVKATLNLSEKVFALQGTYCFKGRSELEFLLCFSEQNSQSVWWMGLQLRSFRLSDITSSLEGVERFLGVKEIEAAVFLSNAEQRILVCNGQLLPKVHNDMQNAEVVLCGVDNGKGLLIEKGLTFRIKLVLADHFLKEILNFQDDCMVSGFIPAEKNQTITLSGYAKEIIFLSFIHLTDFKVIFKKQPGVKVFSFSANGTLQTDFPNLALPEIDVDIAMEENQKHKKVKLTGEVGRIENPLGIPNTILESLVFYAISETSLEKQAEKTEEVYLAGTAQIAGVSLKAMILFADRRPAVVEIGVGSEDGQCLSISKLVRQYCNFEWKDYLDIKLYNGRIWYCADDKRISVGDKVYLPGFHAQVDTEIFFLPEFTLSIDWDDVNGLTAGAQLIKAVDFAFIRLYSKEKGENSSELIRGPKVSLKVPQKGGKCEFILCTDIDIFSVKVGNVKIYIGEEELSGEIELSDNLPICGKIGFTSNGSEFRLKECMIDKPPQINFTIPDMSPGSGSCKVKILESPRIKTTPQIKSQGIDLNKEGLEATFSVIVELKSESVFSEDGGDEVAKICFDKLTLTIKSKDYSSFSFETFMDVLGENIGHIGAEAFEQALNGECFKDIMTEEGMKNLIRFLTIEGITWGINELVSYLICQGLEELLTKSLVAALTSVLPSLWEGLEGVALFFAGFLGVLNSNGNYTAGKRAPDLNNSQPDKSPALPDAPQVSFEGEELVIEWSACENAAGYYSIVTGKDAAGNEVRLTLVGSYDSEREKYRSTGKGIIEDDANDIYGAQQLYRVSYGCEYQISVYAWNQEGAVIGPETSIYLLKRPANLSAHYYCADNLLRVTWDAVERAEEYEVEIKWEEQGKTMRETVICQEDDERTIAMRQKAGHSVTVSVRGKAERVNGPCAAWNQFWLYYLKAPENIKYYCADEGIAVEWEQTAYADRYRVVCRDNTGSRVDMQEVREVKTVIATDKLLENISYQIQIQPMTEEIDGEISQEIIVLWKLLSTPNILELICGEDGIMQVVFEVENVKYKQLVYPDGRMIALSEQQIPCEWVRGEHAKVRLVEQARQGRWSQPISLEMIPTPQEVIASVHEGNLYIAWKNLGEAYMYGIEIVRGSRRQIIEPVDDTQWQGRLDDLPGNRSIRVCLYAIDRADQRRRSNAVEVTL